jgi:SAM-dependent methyltransferase
VAIDETQRTSFDRNAELYDAVRPSYPEALVDEAVERSQIPARGRVLEIGAGTGKATVLFARRGYAMVALEPGVNLAKVLRKNLARFPNAHVEETTFEAWQGADGSFDLAISAQAFHWVDPEVRYVKTSAALRPGGALAVIRNETCGVDPAVQAELAAAYARWFPSVTWSPARDSVETHRADVTAQIERSGLFGPVHASTFPWTATYTTRQYLSLLDTHSDHAQLASESRRALYDAIADVLERNGGRIEVPYVAVLLLAQSGRAAG